MRWMLWRRAWAAISRRFLTRPTSSFSCGPTVRPRVRLTAIIHGSGREYRQLDEIVATGRAVIVPVNFPQPPSVATVEDSLDVSLAELMHWDIAPENPARLDAAGVTIALDQPRPARSGDVSGGRAAGGRAGTEARQRPEGGYDDAGGADRHGRPAGQDRAGHGSAIWSSPTAICSTRQTKVVETWVDGRRFELDKPPDDRCPRHVAAGISRRRRPRPETEPENHRHGAATRAARSSKAVEGTKRPKRSGLSQVTSQRIPAWLSLRRQIARQRRSGPARRRFRRLTAKS